MLKFLTYDFFQDSADVNSVISEIWANRKIRSSPYIIKIGSTFNIPVDGKEFSDSPVNTMEAIVNLLSIYYVFNIRWCASVRKVFLFFQSKFLGKVDTAAERCADLASFVNMFDVMSAKPDP